MDPVHPIWAAKSARGDARRISNDPGFGSGEADGVADGVALDAGIEALGAADAGAVGAMVGVPGDADGAAEHPARSVASATPPILQRRPRVAALGLDPPSSMSSATLPRLYRPALRQRTRRAVTRRWISELGSLPRELLR
jgi:hypothetical protein